MDILTFRLQALAQTVKAKDDALSARITILEDAGAASATWGVIGGTLADQTDLETALGGLQPIDADLTAIAALAGTSGLLRKTAANTWSLDTTAFLTANQTITLSGDVTGSGATAIAVSIGANKVTRAMLAQTAGATILGATAAGNVSDLTAAQAKTFLAITASDVSGLGYFATGTAASNLTGTVNAAQMPALTGDVTTSAGSVATTIAAGAVTLAKMASMATASLIYRKTAGSGAPEVNSLATLKTDLGLTGTNSGDQTITLTGDVTGSGTSSFATTIPAGTVTLAKMANMATASLIYRKTAGSGAPEVNTLATLKTDLGLTGTNSGDQTITLTGDVTGSGAGSFAATIAAGAVGLSKMANLAANSILGNNTGSAATPLALTAAQVTAMLNQATSTLQGLVPASGGGTTNFLRADMTWAAPPGGGSGTTTNALTFNISGGAAAGSTFNGASALTADYSTVGAMPLLNAKLASTANFANTSPTSTVLTASATGTTTIDGTVLALNDLVLLKNQTNAQENGLYKVTTAGATGVATVLTRDARLNTWAQLASSPEVTVQTGTVNADSVWLSTADSGGTLGTTAVNFKCVAFSTLTISSAGISVTGDSSVTGNCNVGNALFMQSNAYIWLQDAGATTRGKIGAGASGTVYDSDLHTFRNLAGTSKATLDSSGNFNAVGTVTGSNLSGTNTGDQTITLTGDVTGSGTGSFATTVTARSKRTVFTANGTWTKDSRSVIVVVRAWGAGGGSGSGAHTVSGTASSGGGGGGGGAYIMREFSASELGATETVAIGAGGTAGTGVSATGAGNNGGAGGNTTFGSWLLAAGGGAGAGGQSAGNSGGGGGAGTRAAGGNASGATAGTSGASGGGAGGSGVGSGFVGSASVASGGSGGANGAAGLQAGSAAEGGMGGGSGGGVSATPTAFVGGAGTPLQFSSVAAPSAGAINGAGGSNSGTVLDYQSGAGGAGGGSSITGNGGAGGAGQTPAGGAGGGGSCIGASGTNTSGAGAVGGAGLIVVEEFF